MHLSISHDRNLETPEAKARWFQSLTMEERAEVFCSFIDLILALNPGIVEQKDVKPVPGRIRVLRKA